MKLQLKYTFVNSKNYTNIFYVLLKTCCFSCFNSVPCSYKYGNAICKYFAQMADYYIRIVTNEAK